MRTKTWSALIALYLIWGSTYLAIRFVVETIPPFLSAGLRFVTAGAILFTWRRLAGEPMPPVDLIQVGEVSACCFCSEAMA